MVYVGLEVLAEARYMLPWMSTQGTRWGTPEIKDRWGGVEIVPDNVRLCTAVDNPSVWRSSLKTGKRPRLDRTRTGKDQDQTRPRPEKTAKKPVLIDRSLWLRPVWTGRLIPPIDTFNLSLYPSKLVEIWQCYGQNYKISDKKSRCDGNKSYLTQFFTVFNVTGLILKLICQSTIPTDK